MKNRNFEKRAHRFVWKIRILFLLVTLWFLLMGILLQTTLLNSKPICGAMILLMVILVIFVNTMHCPRCGAWIALQTPIWKYFHFRCCRCGFFVDDFEP